MKNLLSVFTLLLCFTANAQTFEWNSKSGAATAKEVRPSGNLPAYEKAYNERQSGLAGIYNPSLHNSRTIYGETYNSAELTASHGILPLGTLVKVVNLDNSKTVTVRINDRGQECSDCLLMLSQAAADALGINYRGRVSAERVGFSNWNPAPPRPATASGPVAYGNPSPYESSAYGRPAGGIVRPVAIDGQTIGYRSKGAVSSAGSVAGRGVPIYGQAGQVTPRQSSTPRGAYAALSAPAVVSREVAPAAPPATYSRRPTVVAPQSSYRGYGQAPAYQQPTYPPQASPSVYRQPTYPPTTGYPQPAYQTVPVQQAPQAAPPRPTVPRYQAKGTTTPESYGQVRPANAPTTYATPPAAPAAAPSGYAIQLGAYINELYAKNRVNELKNAGLANVFYLAATKADGQIINRVYAGTFANMAAAQSAATGIRDRHQIAGIVTRL